MAGRRPSRTESEVVREKPAISEPVRTAGINRSGKQRAGQLADFESSIEPTVGNQKESLLSNQLVEAAVQEVDTTADPLESELPVQTDLSASICDEIENNQIAGSSNTFQEIQQIQSDLRSDSAGSESEETSRNCGEKEISELLSSIRAGITMSDKEKEKDSEKGKEGEPEVQIVRIAQQSITVRN